MQAMVVGIAAVGILVGLFLGRTTERARRGMKDYTAAKAAVPKGRQIAFTEVRKAVIALLILGFVLVVVFMGAFGSGHSQ